MGQISPRVCSVLIAADRRWHGEWLDLRYRNRDSSDYFGSGGPSAADGTGKPLLCPLAAHSSRTVDDGTTRSVAACPIPECSAANVAGTALAG